MKVKINNFKQRIEREQLKQAVLTRLNEQNQPFGVDKGGSFYPELLEQLDHFAFLRSRIDHEGEHQDVFSPDAFFAFECYLELPTDTINEWSIMITRASTKSPLKPLDTLTVGEIAEAKEQDSPLG